jgi:metallophosphoesterase superfamily enzyme
MGTRQAEHLVSNLDFTFTTPSHVVVLLGPTDRTGEPVKTTIIIPDVQLPYHDQLMLDKLIRVVKDVQPDAILQIGDLIDAPQVSRWSVGTAGAYATTLQAHITQTKEGFFAPLREAAPEAAITWLSGNHDERITDFVTKYGFPLKNLEALSMENLFELGKFNVQYVKGPVRVGTNVYAVHGHESGGYAATLSAWDTKYCKRYGSDKSFVFGHTHQGGIISRAFGYSGKVSPRFTMNVGSIMDPAAATYVKDGAVSWVQSFGVLHDDGKRVYPELILATDRGFIYAGKKY